MDLIRIGDCESPEFCVTAKALPSNSLSRVSKTIVFEQKLFANIIRPRTKFPLFCQRFLAGSKFIRTTLRNVFIAKDIVRSLNNSRCLRITYQCAQHG